MRFGGIEQIKEVCSDARGTAALEALARDTRRGLRRLLRDWRFTMAAVLILGLAISANTAIFSLVYAVLFRQQAVADPDRLVNIYQIDQSGRPMIVTSNVAYKAMAEYTDVFARTMAGSVSESRRHGLGNDREGRSTFPRGAASCADSGRHGLQHGPCRCLNFQATSPAP